MKLLFAFFLLLAFSVSYGQVDTAKHKNDSLLNSRLERESLKVKQLAAERLTDSLKRADLENQVAQLKSTDQLKRAGLLKELATLKQSDSLRQVKQKHQ
jgi:predicted site-specific integrase-resolvase